VTLLESIQQLSLIRTAARNGDVSGNGPFMAIPYGKIQGALRKYVSKKPLCLGGLLNPCKKASAYKWLCPSSVLDEPLKQAAGDAAPKCNPIQAHGG
jgi:hypothetical protein